MTIPQWLPAAVGWATMMLLVILGVGRLTIWAVVWVEGKWRLRRRERRSRVRRTERPGVYFASDRAAADWLIADSAGRPRV